MGITTRHLIADANSEVIQLFQSVDEQLGKVTALVNNAGILEPQMRVKEADKPMRVKDFTMLGQQPSVVNNSGV